MIGLDIYSSRSVQEYFFKFIQSSYETFDESSGDLLKSSQFSFAVFSLLSCTGGRRTQGDLRKKLVAKFMSAEPWVRTLLQFSISLLWQRCVYAVFSLRRKKHFVRIITNIMLCSLSDQGCRRSNFLWKWASFGLHKKPWKCSQVSFKWSRGVIPPVVGWLAVITPAPSKVSTLDISVVCKNNNWQVFSVFFPPLWQ